MNSDLIDLLTAFNRLKVRYFVAGGHAVMYYVGPRYTKDLDIAVASTPADLERLGVALEEFGFPIPQSDLSQFGIPNRMIVFGYPPNRIDLMNELKGLSFEDAYARRVEGRLGDQIVPMISIDDLIITKRASNRPQDLLDLELLLKARDH